MRNIRRALLILGQILVELHIAPDLAAAINLVDVELGGFDSREVKVSEDAWSLVDQSPEGSVGSCEVQNAGDRKVGNGIAEDERVVEDVEEV